MDATNESQTNSSTTSVASSNKNRIESLDLLRGFALLGILIMNIISFSNIGTGYLNPKIGAGLEGYNSWIHGFSYLFADMRFMSLFSILFGAGVILFTDNMRRKNKSEAKFHFRRMVLLLIFGLIHAYLIWSGDILVAYSICGCLIYFMRKWSTKRLFIWGSIFFVIPILLSFSTYFFSPPDQLAEIFAFFDPSQAKIDEEIAIFTGTYMDQLPLRSAGAYEMQTFLFLYETMWRALSMMMLGMVLYKSGVLSGQRNASFYKKLVFYGMTIGLIVSGIGLYRSYTHDWDGAWVMNIGHQYNYIAASAMVLGYIGTLLLWHLNGKESWLKTRLKAVGRTAFTNYILTSVLCTFIFYGHGLGYFGQFDRLEQWGIILLVWAIIIFTAHPILKKFGQGPLEKLWRKLTYL